MMASYEGIIKRYKNFLPVGKNTPIISLNEGFTPLISSQFLAEKYNAEIYFKFEL